MQDKERALIYPNFPKELIESQLHLNRYIKFIDSRPIRKKIKFETEHHHKIPKSLGGSDLDENKIHLTLREHYLAHFLLWKAIGGKMIYPFWRMTHSKQNGSKNWITSRQYAKLKASLSKKQSKPYSKERLAKVKRTMKKNGTSPKGKKWSEERKVKNRETRRKNGTEYGKKVGPQDLEKKQIITQKRKETMKKNGTSTGPSTGKWSDEKKAKANSTREKNGTKAGGKNRCKQRSYTESEILQITIKRKETMKKNGTSTGLESGTKLFINNGDKEKMILKNDLLPDGWVYGRFGKDKK